MTDTDRTNQAAAVGLLLIVGGIALLLAGCSNRDEHVAQRAADARGYLALWRDTESPEYVLAAEIQIDAILEMLGYHYTPQEAEP